VCGRAFNDAPSYRAAEAPLGREVQREVLTGQAAIHPLSSVTRRRTVTVRQESDFFLPFVAVSAEAWWSLSSQLQPRSAQKTCPLRSQHSYVVLLSPERDYLVTRTP